MNTILRLLAAIVVFSTGALLAQDTEGPMLTAISIASPPGGGEVGSGDWTTTVSLTITDNDSGFASTSVTLYRPDGNFVRSSFQAFTPSTSGTFDIPITVSQYSPAGTWRVRVTLRDAASNSRSYGQFGSDEAFPVPGDETFPVINTGTTDNTDPQFSNIVITPNPLVPSGSPEMLSIAFDASDDLSGVSSATFSFFDPSSNQVFGIPTSVSPSPNGALSGSYVATAFFDPSDIVIGSWFIAITVRDEAGNRGSGFNPPGGTFEFSSGGADLGDLSDGCDATHFTWTTSGDSNWFVQGDTTCDGIDAAQSGVIGPFGATEMSVGVTGPGTLDFQWKVSSEEFNDTLRVELDGSYEDEISGEVDWTSGSVSIPPGPATVTWIYEKNDNTDVGDDTGWVDKVKFTSDTTDAQDPVLQRISISPSPVDISGGDVDVTITLEITDDFNGVAGGQVEFYDPNGENYDSTSFGSFDLVSGDSNCGTYEVQITINQADLLPPDFFDLGTWRADVCVTEAMTFNDVTYGPFGDPFPIPGAENFEVADGVGGSDTSGPTLDAINSISPDPVDITAGMQTVNVNFDISDNSSGFNFGSVQLYNANGNFVDSFFFDTNNEVSSSGPLSATYQVAIEVPQYGAPGTWSLNFNLNDNVGNERHYPFDDPFPNPGDENFTVTNTGPADNTDPVVNSVTIMPGTVDTSTSVQTINVSVDATDDLSGLRWIFLYVYDPNDVQQGDLFQFLAGNGATSGPFAWDVDIPQGSEEGTWEVGVFMRDQAGNSVRYGISGTESFPTPGENEFTVGPTGTTTTFDNFVANFSLTGPDALPNANPDKDPFTNAEELLLGLNPNVPDLADPAKFGTSKTAAELRLNFSVDPTLNVSIAGDYLSISDATGTPFLVTGETSGTLAAPWSKQLPANTAGTTYTVSLPFVFGPNGHIRLGFLFP